MDVKLTESYSYAGFFLSAGKYLKFQMVIVDVT